MSDKAKRAHDLALLVTSEWLSRDFESAINSDNDGDEKREVLAASVLDEYEFFYDHFMTSMK